MKIDGLPVKEKIMFLETKIEDVVCRLRREEQYSSQLCDIVRLFVRYPEEARIATDVVDSSGHNNTYTLDDLNKIATAVDVQIASSIRQREQIGQCIAKEKQYVV